MNSRTSRPRSPTRATTDTAASVPRATIDSSVDLPTPEPAMMLIRWPRPQGTSASARRTPRPAWRSIASGSAPRGRRSPPAPGAGPRARDHAVELSGRAVEHPALGGRPVPAAARRCCGRGRRCAGRGVPQRQAELTPCGVLATTSAGTTPASRSPRRDRRRPRPRRGRHRCGPLSSTGGPGAAGGRPSTPRRRGCVQY